MFYNIRIPLFDERYEYHTDLFITEIVYNARECKHNTDLFIIKNYKKRM